MRGVSTGRHAGSSCCVKRESAFGGGAERARSAPVARPRDNPSALRCAAFPGKADTQRRRRQRSGAQLLRGRTFGLAAAGDGRRFMWPDCHFVRPSAARRCGPLRPRAAAARAGRRGEGAAWLATGAAGVDGELKWQMEGRTCPKFRERGALTRGAAYGSACGCREPDGSAAVRRPRRMADGGHLRRSRCGSFMLSRHRRCCAPQRCACAAVARSAQRGCGVARRRECAALSPPLALRFSCPPQSADRASPRQLARS